MLNDSENSVSFEGLPGAELVRQGLIDLQNDTESKYSLLLSVAAPRLRGLHIDIPNLSCVGSFEHRLYDVLEREYGDGAYSQYNALIRRIVSFESLASEL